MPRRRQLRIGLTLPEYEQKLAEQNGGCALCGRPPKTRRLAVDHNHTTGTIRGLLCYYCNRRVVGRHTLAEIRKILAYLEKYECPKEPGTERLSQQEKSSTSDDSTLGTSVTSRFSTSSAQSARRKRRT